MVTVGVKLLGVGVLLLAGLGRHGWRWRTTQNATPEDLAALRPTIFVPRKNVKDEQYGEVVARKV